MTDFPSLSYITVGYLTHCPSTKEYLKVFFKIDILTTGTPYSLILLRQTMLSTSRSLCTYKHLSDRSHNALNLYISYLNFISSYISYLTLCIWRGGQLCMRIQFFSLCWHPFYTYPSFCHLFFIPIKFFHQ